MSRKSDGGSPAKTAAQLRSLRSQIDKLDVQIQKLLNERAKVAAEAVDVRADGQVETFVPSREDEMIQHLLQVNKGPLDPLTLRAIFRELNSGSRALQKILKVAYLGPDFGNSHHAVLERFGQSVEGIAVGSIAAVFEEVNRGHADYGVVPLENSPDGRLSDTLELFVRHTQIKIIAEVRLRMHHHLLSNASQPEIRRVYSRSQILAQTRSWLSKNLPQAQAVEVTSTAVAAELAAREPGAAAIASRHAANRYGLKVLFADIEDSPIGESRFGVVSIRAAQRSGKDRTALIFQLRHHPGALVDALTIFKQAKINLHALEAFPARGSKGEMMFFLDFDGHIEETKVKKAVDTLTKQAEKLILLGSFPVSEVTD